VRPDVWANGRESPFFVRRHNAPLRLMIHGVSARAVEAGIASA